LCTTFLSSKRRFVTEMLQLIDAIDYHCVFPVFFHMNFRSVDTEKAPIHVTDAGGSLPAAEKGIERDSGRRWWRHRRSHGDRRHRNWSPSPTTSRLDWRRRRSADRFHVAPSQTQSSPNLNSRRGRLWSGELLSEIRPKCLRNFLIVMSDILTFRLAIVIRVIHPASHCGFIQLNASLVGCYVTGSRTCYEASIRQTQQPTTSTLCVSHVNEQATVCKAPL